MEQIEATSITNLGLNLKKQGDLLYHDGPLLSHFINVDNTNEHYLYKWTDCDESCNRWLIFRVSLSRLKSFFEKKYNLLQLINENPFVYFIDLDNDLSQKSLVVCSINKIPADYLPSENSFFKEIQYEKYAIELKNSLLEEANISANKNNSFDIIMHEVLNIKASQLKQNSLLNLIINRLNVPLKKQID